MTAAALELLTPALSEDAPKVLHWIDEKIDRRLRRLINQAAGVLLPRWQRRRLVARRIERLDAMVRVAKAMNRHMDIVSQRIGKPRGRMPDAALEGVDGDPRYVCPPGQKKIVEETGLTITRVRRAIREFVRLGWLSGPRRGQKQHRQRRIAYTNAKGERAYSACRVVYRWADAFFERLGISHKLKREQGKAYDRARGGRVYSGPLVAGRAAVAGFAEGSRERRPMGAPAPLRGTSIRPPSSTHEAENEARRRVRLQLELRQHHPEWSPGELRAEAERLLALERPGGS